MGLITNDQVTIALIEQKKTGKMIGRHRSTGISRPRFYERAEYYNAEDRLAAAIARRPTSPAATTEKPNRISVTSSSCHGSR